MTPYESATCEAILYLFPHRILGKSPFDFFKHPKTTPQDRAQVRQKAQEILNKHHREAAPLSRGEFNNLKKYLARPQGWIRELNAL